MHNFRRNIFLLTLLCQFFQGLSGQSYFFKLSDDSITNISFYEDSVRILTLENNILYLGEDGFLSSEPVSISKSRQNDFQLTLLNGGVEVEKNTNYQLILFGKSIRHIGKNFIGTYDGIFKNGKKFSPLTYSSGTIREHGDSIMVCWDGFTIYHNEDSYDFTSYDSIGTIVQGERLGFTRDVQILEDHIFFLTTKGVFRLNTTTRELITVYEEPNDKIQYFDTEIGTDGKTKSFLMGVNNKRLRVFLNGNYLILDRYESKFTFFNTAQYILLLENEVKDIPKQRAFSVNRSYHCVFKINDIYFGASDDGLFAIVDENNPIQLNDIEFNARSFRISRDTVYLGSVNGLYSYPFKFLLKEVDSKKKPENNKPVNYLLLSLVVIGFIILSGFIALLVNVNKRIDKVVSKKLPAEVTKNSLMEYISLNISTISIAGLCEEFHLNQKELYRYFPESSPGAVIKQMRLFKAKSLYDEGKSTEIIALETGYSKKYLSQTILPQLRKK
jgi:AraC-like DNA-binding protein